MIFSRSKDLIARDTLLYKPLPSKRRPHASFGNPLSFIVSRVSAVLSIHSTLFRLSLLPLRENTVYGIPDDIYHTEITVDTYMQNTQTADRKNKNVRTFR